MNARVRKLCSKKIFITCEPPSTNTRRTRKWRHSTSQIWSPQVIFTRSRKTLLPIPPTPGSKSGKICRKISAAAIPASPTSTAALHKSQAKATATTVGNPSLTSSVFTSSTPMPATETPSTRPDAAPQTASRARRDKYALHAPHGARSTTCPIVWSRH